MKFSDKKKDLIGCICFIVLTMVLLLRLIVGVDFSDEAYYAFFIDDWLKGSIVSSSFLSIHQTAALLIYPFSLAYFKLQHSTSGLFLFLRCLFLLFNFIAASMWMLFLRRFNFKAAAWLGGIIVLTFIPFGLPAPSYNTLSIQFLTIALAALGLLLTGEQFSKEQLVWMIISAIAWTIVIIAYPSLLGAWLFLCTLVLLYRSTFTRPWLCLCILICASCAGLIILVNALSFDRLYQSTIYISAVNSTADLIRKYEFSMMYFKQNTIFTCLFIAAILHGIFRNILPPYWQSMIMSFIFVILLFTPATFLTHSHDAFTLATLMGLGLISGLKQNAVREDRIIAIIYSISLVASIIICLTATNSVFNFCIGSVPAASLAVLGLPSTVYKRFNMLPPIIFILCILSTSLFLYYGEIPSNGSKKRQYVSHGFFAGLFIRQNEFELLQLVEQSVSPILTEDSSIAIFARNPGIVLSTPARLKMLTPYPLTQIARNGIEVTHAFYMNPKNRPNVVLIYHDSSFTPINPMQPDFLTWYILSSSFKLSNGGELEVYLKN